MSVATAEGYDRSPRYHRPVGERPRIAADFGNVDPEGRLRLNAAGAARDLARCDPPLESGAEIIVYDDELEAAATLDVSIEEGIWVARIDQSEAKRRPKATPGEGVWAKPRGHLSCAARAFSQTF